MSTAKEISKDYDSGLLNGMSLFNSLFELPMHQPVDDFVKDVPLEWLQEIRQHCEELRTESARNSAISLTAGSGTLESEEAHRQATKGMA